MVKDNLDKTSGNTEQNKRVETQNGSHHPEEHFGSAEQNQCKIETENQHSEGDIHNPLPCNSPLDQDNIEEKAQIQATAKWKQATGADPWPTHFHTFTCEAECNLVRLTHRQLQHSGYYWGPMTMEEAHQHLSLTPQGTFLIRDSGQPNVFFTLSYQGNDGPTSIRVVLTDLVFNLYGSQKTFASLFDLLSYYMGSACKLRRPYRQQQPEHLKQLCRRAVISTYGADNIDTLPGINIDIKDFLHAYPYST